MNGLLIQNNPHASAQHFVDAIEAKDSYTQGHSHHVSAVAGAIFDCLPPALRRKMDRERLFIAALLHDIGKVETPDHVLNKDGPLNGQEWEAMRRHPADGKRMVENTAFAYMGDWVLYHHERMDGRGYYCLAGDQIPLEARVIAVADTFSALRTYRIYRPAKSIEETLRILRECAGTQLDAEILRYFLALDQGFLEQLECNCEICRQRRAALEAGTAALS